MVDQPFTHSTNASQVYVNDIRDSGGYGLTETAINLPFGCPDYLCIWLTFESNKLHIIRGDGVSWRKVSVSLYSQATLEMISKKIK